MTLLQSVRKIYLLDLTPAELEKKVSDFSKEKYRFQQLCDWIFNRRALSFEAMSNLPESFRNDLAHKFALRALEIYKKENASDGTIKFTFRTKDHKFFPAVYLPRNNYHSLCISTQVGCAWKCSFCASGLVPLERNLSCGEILDQIFLSEQNSKNKIGNILFMGMGEPLANYDATLKTIRWLTAPNGFKMSPARITLSTTGVAPQIKKIAEERLNINLALSLHAATDALRKKIMPVSARFPLLEVLDACKIYQSKNKAHLTIEYILLKNVNDSAKDAEQLSELLLSMRFSKQPKINLIPYNPVSSLPYQPPTPARIRAFFNLLMRKKFIVHTRKPQGQDIGAACGQLL